MMSSVVLGERQSDPMHEIRRYQVYRLERSSHRPLIIRVRRVLRLRGWLRIER